MHIGTPAQIARSADDVTPYTFEDTRARRNNTPGDQSMRRTIQDLVANIDPDVKIEPEVEDVRLLVLSPLPLVPRYSDVGAWQLLLDATHEFIKSVTDFGCRLAKHRGGDTLEVRDLQLHLGMFCSLFMLT